MKQVYKKTSVIYRFYFCLLFFLPISISAIGQSHLIKGVVTTNGKGLENVIVSDGINCAVTDAKGNYNLYVSDDSQFVHVSTPSGYLPKDNMNVPMFFERIDIDKTDIYNFELIKNPKDDRNHTVIVHADPQFYKKEEFERYEEIIDDCSETIKEHNDRDVFGIDCGDLSFDKPELYEGYINILNKTGIPFYRVLGNHDLKYGGRTKEQSVSQYESAFGPSNYSFNRGNAHYIVINNVFYVGRDYFYMGYIDERTYSWIEQDLSHVPEGSLVFVSMHIPGRTNEKEQPFKYDSETISKQTVNIAHLLKMLEPYKAHILSGHLHRNNNMIHSENIYEHNTASISGPWWQGGLCTDGTPQGYGVYEINGNNVKWYFKSAGYPREHQMRAYPVGSSQEFPEDIIVNVWNWDKTWKVEWIEDGENRGEMEQFTGYDPGVQKMLADKEKLDFSWIGASKTHHLFKAKPKSSSSKIEIVATDYSGETFRTEVK